MVGKTFDGLAFMNGFNPEELEILRPLFQSVCLPAGAILFEQGSLASQFFIVADGEVVIRYKPEDGPALILTRVRKDGIVGWSAAIGSPTYTSSAVCAVDSQLLGVRSDDLYRLNQENPTLAQQLLERLTQDIANRLRCTPPEIMALLENGMHIQPVNIQ